MSKHDIIDELRLFPNRNASNFVIDSIGIMHRAADEIEHLRPYVEAFRREETRADKFGAEVDELRSQLAAEQARAELFNVRLSNEIDNCVLQEQRTEALRNQLVRAMDMLGDVPGETLEDRIERFVGSHLETREHLAEEEANASRAWSAWENARNQLVIAKAMAQFVKWAMREGPWDGGDLDGGAIQDMAEKLGLLEQTVYDPEKHGEDEWCEEGDSYYVLHPAVSLLSDEQQKPAPKGPAGDAGWMGGEFDR